MKNTLCAIASLVLLATMFTSCGNHDFFNTEPSSSSMRGSSVTKYDYCVLDERITCLFGPFERCEVGVLSNDCPYLSASSSGTAEHSGSSSSVSANGKGNSIKNYETVPIGDQVWMAENLNYDVNGSLCYDGTESTCDIYGRLYDWATMMDLPFSCNKGRCASRINSPHRGICPEGWHIPSGADWNELLLYVDANSNVSSSHYESATAGKHLKAASGWDEDEYDGSNGNGDDKHGFNALPGGQIKKTDLLGNGIGKFGYWWIADEFNMDAEDDKFIYGYTRILRNGSKKDEISRSLQMKENLYSVRCLKNKDGSGQQSSSSGNNDIANYKTEEIGGKKWMAENLNYETGNSLCYERDEFYCAKYGRLYDWATAKTACPAGWHLPNNEEWDALYLQAGSSLVAGGKLKATSGWSLGGNGTDDFGFKALPSGSAFSNGYSLGIGEQGYWWSSTENDDDNAYYKYIYFNEESAGSAYSNKTLFFISVRCVEDD
jgi:uncharacterized protein (TIGR02145 family)